MKKKWFNILVLVALVLGVLPATAMGQTAATPASTELTEEEILDKVDPVVLGELTERGAADYFIVLVEQADVSGADQLRTKEEKGTYVFETLVATAEATQASLREYLDGVGADYRAFYVANTILVRDGSYDLMLSLGARADVESILPNRDFQLQEPFEMEPDPSQIAAVEPNITWIKATDVWAMGYTGAGTVLASGDTGLQWNHPAIINHYRGWDGAVADHNYNWWDATGTYPMVPADGHGHGTHVTGTMVGDDGGTNQIGVAPGAQTIHCKNMTDGGSGNDATFTECFEWILAPWDLAGENPDPALAPDSMANSWGYWGGGQNQFRTIIQNLQTAGIVVEVSAGNEGSSCGSLRSPGDYWEVMTTGSVNHAAAFPGTITGFSSRGPSSLDPGYYFPDIMAPGEGIRSSIPGGYASWSGTSMAGPHSAALIGLMWDACPAYRGWVYETYDIIHETAGPLTGQGGSNCGGDYDVGPNNDWGFGTIDALAAVNEIIGLCGGQGFLEGYVTDSADLSPIEGATVAADWHEGGGWERITDASGYYTFTIPVGLYDVTAEHPHYTTEMVWDLEVFTDTITTQDFALQAKGLLWGYVIDYDNQVPLEGATVTADDGTWAETDADGYYEMYLDEGTYEVTAELQDYAPETAIVEIISGEETQQDFALVAAVVFVPTPLEVTVPWQESYTEVVTLTNRLPWGYDFEFMELPGGFIPTGGSVAVQRDPAPSIPAEVSTGLAPEGYEPQPTEEVSSPTGPWQTRASAPFVSMDNVYLGYDGKGYQIGGYGTNGQVGIYDADTDSWTTGTSAPSPQIEYPVDGCFGFNADGDPVGVLFNDTTSGVTTLKRYNMATDSWDTPPVPAGFPANGLWAHAIASLWPQTGENVCYISGGATAPGGGNTSALYAYYPDTNTVENLGNFNYLAQGMAFHATWYVPWIGTQGGICVGGGVNAASVVSSDTQCYDIGAGVFNATNADLGPMPAGVWGMAHGILYEDGDYQLWIAQGADTAFALWPNSAFYSQNDGQWYIGPTPPRTGYRVDGTNIAAADGCSFYVVGGSSGGFTPTSGHERNFSPDCPPVVGVEVPWFGQDPISGTVPADAYINPTMLFTATYEAGVNQPGDYYCTLRVEGDPRLNVPVKMTVPPPDTMGQLQGYVLDNCTGEPVEADISIAGGDPITETQSAKDTGYYGVWLYPGEYELTFSAAGYVDYSDTVIIVAQDAVQLDVDLVPDRPCIALDPEEIEVWVPYGTEVYTHPTGLDIINDGGQDLSFQLWELPGDLTGGDISSLTGSVVEFDPSVGGDEFYIPGTEQTFCFLAKSHSPDWEYALSVWQMFPSDWVVSSVYVQGTPYCDQGGSFGTFSWTFHTAPYEVRINHPRYHSSGGDTCYAYYCFEVTSAVAGIEAPVSWYWNGDSWGSPPYNPCSDDNYTPSGQTTCDEAINPVAGVPIGAMDVPWFWQDPVSGTVPGLDWLNVDLMFTALDEDESPLPTGEYTATLVVVHNDPLVDTIMMPVTMHIGEVAELTIAVAGEGSGQVTPPEGTHQYVVGQEVTATAEPDIGSYFAGWSGDIVTDTETIVFEIWEDMAITATFELEEYTLDVNVVGEGEVEVDPLQDTYLYGDVVTLTATPEDGWYFDGWTGDVEGLDEVITHTIVGDTVVTATFEVIPIAYVQIAHLAPFAMDPGTAVTVTLDGVPALTDFAYGDSTEYIALPAGEYEVGIWPAGSTEPAISATVELVVDTYYTAIAYGDGVNQDLGLMLLEDDLTPPAPGTFHLRLGHLAPFAPGDATADVRLADGTPILEDVDFGDVTGFIPLPAGEYDIIITTPGGETTLIDPLPVAFEEGQILSAFATGDGVNQDLGVFALPAGDFGFFLPLRVDRFIYLPIILNNFAP